MPDSKRSSDGQFDLFYRNGWAYLTVYPLDAGGAPVYREDVQNRMRLLGIPRVSSARIREIIEEAAGTPERLVEWPEGARLSSKIAVSVSEDEMHAWVEIDAPKKGAAPPTPEDVVKTLEESSVTYGVDVSAIESLLGRKRYGDAVLVASGKPVVHARSAEVAYHFNTIRGKPYLAMEFGRINLKELNFIENKEEGDLLADLLPPLLPEDGRTVRNTLVPAETSREQVELRPGRGTRLSSDRRKLFAAESGNVRLIHGAVVVEPVVTLENVNYETGNIHFDGSVVVEKEIADGFVIEAGGDVQVGRGVGRATIKARGNVLLKTGINGNDAGRIECGGNLFAKYIESSDVRCEGHVFVEEAIMHSQVSAGLNCVLNGRRAEVIASDLVVGGSLWCKKLGSIYEAPTHVFIGIRPDRLESYRGARKAFEANQEEQSMLEEKLDQVRRAIEEGRRDEKMLRARETLKEALSALKEAEPQLHHEVSIQRDKLSAGRESMLVVEDTIYSGAVVLFGKMEYRAPATGARRTILKPGEREIIESGFNPTERPGLGFAEPEPG
jgi:uncharacterized protein